MEKKSSTLAGGNWEEVPDEDLWEDGEIDENRLTLKLFQQIITEGEWKVIREIK